MMRCRQSCSASGPRTGRRALDVGEAARESGERAELRDGAAAERFVAVAAAGSRSLACTRPEGDGHAEGQQRRRQRTQRRSAASRRQHRSQIDTREPSSSSSARSSRPARTHLVGHGRSLQRLDGRRAQAELRRGSASIPWRSARRWSCRLPRARRWCRRVAPPRLASEPPPNQRPSCRALITLPLARSTNTLSRRRRVSGRRRA